MQLKLEDLVARSQQSDLDKYKIAKIIIDDEGNFIIAEKRDIKTVSNILDSGEDKVEQTAMLIYEHCTVLKRAELQSAYDCHEPFEVVERVFLSNMELIEKAADSIMKMYGIGREQGEQNAVDMVKNS